MRLYGSLAGLAMLSSCGPPPAPPDDPVALEKFAQAVYLAVEPGFTLRREREPELWREMRLLGAFGADVLPDTSAVVVRLASFPPNHGYAYLLVEADEPWRQKAKRLGFQRTEGRWWWFRCRWGARPAYPC